MTETLTVAPVRATKQNLRGHVLALVLFAVLVWYTVVSPSYTAAPLRAADAGSADAEEREAEAHPARGFAAARVARPVAPIQEESGVSEGVDELDWPEIIGGD